MVYWLRARCVVLHRTLLLISIAVCCVAWTSGRHLLNVKEQRTMVVYASQLEFVAQGAPSAGQLCVSSGRAKQLEPVPEHLRQKFNSGR